MTSIWEDFIDIFYVPSQVFARREHGSVWPPLIIITLLSGALFYLNSGALQPIFDAEFDRGMASALRDNPKMPAEAIEKMRAIGTRVGQIGMLVFMPFGMLGVAGVMWVAGKLVDARQTFHAALVVAAYAFAPRILQFAINGVQAMFLDPSQLDGQFRLSFGPGRFMDPDETSPLLLAAIGRLDVFTIWITVLVAIGLAVTGRIPVQRAAIAAVIVWVMGGVPGIFGALSAM